MDSLFLGDWFREYMCDDPTCELCSEIGLRTYSKKLSDEYVKEQWVETHEFIEKL